MLSGTSRIRPRATIFVVEDDFEDFGLVWRTFRRLETPCDIQQMQNGQELMESLISCHADQEATLPNLILLDLNMPVMDGREALVLLKKDQRFNRIPVIVFTSSHAQADIQEAYSLGANSVITKPFTLKDLTATLDAIASYWLKMVQLPQASLI